MNWFQRLLNFLFRRRPAEVPPPPRRVTATVRDERGIVLSGATGVLTPDGEPSSPCDTRGDEGFKQLQCETPVQQGGAGLVVAADGYQDAARRIPDLVHGDHDEIHMQRSRGATRRGIVRLDGHAFTDDDGPYLAVGTSLFPAPWLYRHERGRLEQNLAWLTGRPSAVDYVRVLGAVIGNGSPGDPQSNPWGLRSTTLDDLFSSDLIAEVTDLHYDRYGLRTQWTLLGGRMGSMVDLERLAGRFVDQLRDRAHKVQMFEVVNERLGFADGDGIADMRRIGRILRDGLPNLVALTSILETPDDCAALGDGFPLLTVHLDRNQTGTGGRWRPMRQGWDVHFLSGHAWTSNEGIGQNSSVAHEEDPQKLAVFAALNWLFGAAGHVHHTGSGVYMLDQTHPHGGFRPANLWDVESLGATLDGFGAIRAILPPDLPNFEGHNTNGAFPGYPFDVGSLGAAVTLYDGSGGRRGMLRAFAGTHGDRFVVIPIDVVEPQRFEARRGMTFRVYDPLTGAVRETVTLDAGQTWTLEPTEAAICVGTRV